ncbi:hypothetical protein SNEBB_008736 [Seison nebaliae]|nr:hypothetical protein SNEBB_008736 [Seison nebaliae]
MAFEDKEKFLVVADALGKNITSLGWKKTIPELLKTNMKIRGDFFELGHEFTGHSHSLCVKLNFNETGAFIFNATNYFQSASTLLVDILPTHIKCKDENGYLVFMLQKNVGTEIFLTQNVIATVTPKPEEENFLRKNKENYKTVRKEITFTARKHGVSDVESIILTDDTIINSMKESVCSNYIKFKINLALDGKFIR